MNTVSKEEVIFNWDEVCYGSEYDDDQPIMLSVSTESVSTEEDISSHALSSLSEVIYKIKNPCVMRESFTSQVDKASGDGSKVLSSCLNFSLVIFLTAIALFVISFLAQEIGLEQSSSVATCGIALMSVGASFFALTILSIFLPGSDKLFEAAESLLFG
ncbi:hypothetical protein [Candidatus Ichthyocystis sparus]|uniref:hypothetical protein n=1 Tax=Candidatus Ichthyocystis sparus TaxID=1561004 RepID=UPI000AAE5A11|nr:hypothetical protein [Candidatus Ichthyocystis sparus]